MHLVTGGAVGRLVLPHERLDERPAVRFGVQVSEEPVHPAQHRIAARGELVQRRVLDGEAAVPHRPLDVGDRMARRAGQPRLRFRRVDLILDRLLEAAVEKDGVIVATRTPLAGLGAGHRLHVFDRFPVELVVERGEVVGGALPLLVHVLVTFAAQFRVHEEVRRNDAADVGLRGRGEEGRRGTASFVGGGQRRDGWIDDAMARVRVRPCPNRRGRGKRGQENDGGHQHRGELAQTLLLIPAAPCVPQYPGDAGD